MKIFTCKICGEVYIGPKPPKSCPFCGVSNKYLRMADVWEDENKNVKLSEVSKRNMEGALKLELSNAAFYKCLSKTISNTEVALMFKGLFKVEREHASVFRKILGIEGDLEIEEECIDNPMKAVEESYKREQNAVDFYTKALAEAVEPRVKEVLEAIMETEKDHLELDEKMNKKLLE